jgi:hypothetical protein
MEGYKPANIRNIATRIHCKLVSQPNGEKQKPKHILLNKLAYLEGGTR